MTNTENHDYQRPSPGSQNWNAPLNANFTKLETDVEIRDTDANKGNYTAYVGAKYVTTDSPYKIYFGDGTNWVEIANLSNIGSGSLDGLSNVSAGLLSNMPASGNAGDWYFTTDSNGIYHDPDGNGFILISEHPSNIDAGELGFDPATQAELDSHAGDASAHHTRYTAEEVRDTVAAFATAGTDISITHNDAGDTLTFAYTGGSGATQYDAIVSDDANLQTTLNNVTGADADGRRALVVCEAGLVIDPGTTITVPPGVFLDCTGATFEPSTNYDGFFIDNGAGIRVRALTGATYTSRVVYADTGLSTYGKYTGDTTAGGSKLNRGCDIYVEHLNNDLGSPPVTATDRGTSVELYAHAAPSGTTGFGTDVHVEVRAFNISTAFRAKAEADGYVNPIVDVSSTWCHTAIKCEGAGDANFMSTGEIQPGLGAEYGIHNTTGSVPYFEGLLWDPSLFDTASLAGSCKVVTAVTGAQHFIGTTDGSNYQTVTAFTGGNDVIAVYNASSNTAYRWNMDNVGNINIEENTTGGGTWTRLYQFDVSLGDLNIAGQVNPNTVF